MNLNPPHQSTKNTVTITERGTCLETIKRLINTNIVPEEAKLRSATQSRIIRFKEAELPEDTKNHVEEFQTEVRQP